MSEFQKCSICGEFGFALSHRCPPAWDVVIIPAGDDPEFPERTRHGSHAVSVAEHAVADWTAEHGAACPVEVWVRRSGGDGDWQKFTVTMEMVPSFYAERMD